MAFELSRAPRSLRYGASPFSQRADGADHRETQNDSCFSRRAAAARCLQHNDAAIEIIGGQMRVTHGHRQGLVAEPHLHAPDVDAALDQTRRAGVPQDMRHHLLVGAKADLGFRIVPDGAELRLAELGERTFGPAAFSAAA